MVVIYRDGPVTIKQSLNSISLSAKMSNNDTVKQRNELKGRENYLPLLTRLEGILVIDNVIIKNEETYLFENSWSKSSC
jgi:hypothetical protein